MTGIVENKAISIYADAEMGEINMTVILCSNGFLTGLEQLTNGIVTGLELFFMQYLHVSLTAGIMILLVLLLRRPLAKLSKNITMLLWMIVLLRLLCPFTLELDFGLPQSGISMTRRIHETIRNEKEETMELDGTYDGLIEKAGGTMTDFSEIDLSKLSYLQNLRLQWQLLPAGLKISLVIWILGVAGMGIYLVRSRRKLQNYLSRLSVSEEGQMKIYGRTIRIYYLDGLYNSFVSGLFRLKIYLPADLEQAEKNYILMHEKMHIRYLDSYVKLLSYILLALHWFNPAMWLLVRYMSEDMEMRCDESVLRCLGNEHRQSYAGTLLKMADGNSEKHYPVTAFGEASAGRRIKRVINRKKVPAVVTVLAVLFCLVFAVGFSLRQKQGGISGIFYAQGDSEYFDRAKEEALFRPVIYLNDDGTFSFIYDSMSSWAVDGDYIIKGDVLTAKGLLQTDSEDWDARPLEMESNMDQSENSGIYVKDFVVRFRLLRDGSLEFLADQSSRLEYNSIGFQDLSEDYYKEYELKQGSILAEEEEQIDTQ